MTNHRQKQEKKIEDANKLAAVRVCLSENGIQLDTSIIKENLERIHSIVEKASGSGSALTREDLSEFTGEQVQELQNLNHDIDAYLRGADKPMVLKEFTQELVLPNGTLSTAYMVIIPPHLIDSETYVIEENSREQDSLNEITLNYILKTLKPSGQLKPGEGFWDAEKGQYGIMDGSSRRASCKIGSRPFRFWCLDKKPNSDVAKYVSKVSNDSKGPSSYELGKEMVKWGAENGNPKLNIIAEQFQQKPSRASVFMNAYLEVPKDIYAYFPSRTSVSRECLEVLVPAYRRLKKVAGNEDVHASLIEKVDLMVKGNVEPEMSDKEVLEEVMTAIGEFAPATTTSKQPEWNHAKETKYKIKSNNKDNTHVLTLKEPSEKVLSKFQEFIDSLN